MYFQTKSVKSTCHSPLETQSSSPRVIQYCIVVCRDVQVQEKLFKILMCQSYNSKVNSFLCCSSIFIMTRALPKAAILKLMQNIQLKVVIFMKIKKSPVEIDRLLKISFQFLSSGPSFSFLSDPSPILVYPCH